MSYEVVKTISGRKYRYEVESHRDSATGKVRNKWRYLGKAEGDAPPRHRRRAEETRSALMRSLEELLEHTPWQDVTVLAIARGAALAEATFYRYFKSRADVLFACAQQIVDEGDLRLASLAEIAETVEAERRRLRERAVDALTNPRGNAVFFALWVSGGSDELRTRRNEHRRSAFVEYLKRLRQSDYITIKDDEIDEAARGLAVFAQALSYRTVIERRPLEQDEAHSVGLLFERIVFGR
jgi:AcrR family transcriptional regulator